MNNLVNYNFEKIKSTCFIAPIILLLIICSVVYFYQGFSTIGYVEFQKPLFLDLNQSLSQYPNLMYELTQLGDALIMVSILSILFLYAPKVFEVLVIASLISLLVSFGLKNLFSIPRPGAILDTDSFTSVGRVLRGRNSFPSGHSMTIFLNLTILMYAFAPRKNMYKYLWFAFLIAIGGVVLLTRIGVGAHYPVDVVVGGIIGYLIALVSIYINRKYDLWSWLKNKKFYPLVFVIITSFIIALITKVTKSNLIIYYISIITLFVTLYKTIVFYVKR